MVKAVQFPVPPEVAFDYLVDPANRPAWQSSLRSVEDIDGVPRVGQTWVDVTMPGLRPLMETTLLERPHRWTEIGTWHGIAAELTLDFAAYGTDTMVTPTFEVTGRGPAAVPAYLANKVAVFAVIPDLKRAAQILGRASGPSRR